MNLIFSTTTRDCYQELKDRLDDKKIRYNDLDSDAFKIGFKIAKDKAQEFEMDLVNNVMGNTIHGTFYTQPD
jgi:hypothetical protein